MCVRVWDIALQPPRSSVRMSSHKKARKASHEIRTRHSTRDRTTANYSGDAFPSAIGRWPTTTELEQLSSLGLHFNQPEPAIICKPCGFALKADQDRVSRHLGERHGLTKRARFGLNKLVQSLQLPDPSPRRLCTAPSPGATPGC